MTVTKKILFVLILFYGCASRSDRQVSDALKEAVSKFRQEYKADIVPGDYSTIKRSVSLNKYGVTFQLRENTNIKSTSCPFMIVMSKNAKCYAVPYPSDFYSSYWEFENEKTPKSKLTFSSELNNAFQRLNNNRVTPDSLLRELFFSLMQFREIEPGDTVKNSFYLFSHSDRGVSIGKELDECEKRNELSRKQIFQSMKVKRSYVWPFPYFDPETSKAFVYTLENTSEQGYKFKIKTFRIGCTIRGGDWCGTKY